LTAQAGLPAVRRLLPPVAMFGWGVIAAALAAEVPWWEPGTRHGYHLLTFGWLVGEVVRRVSGRSLGTFFRDEVARRLAVDFHIGLAPEEEARAAEVVQGPPPAPDDPIFKVFTDPESMIAKAVMNPPFAPEM